jgi:hypothetical protein
MVLFNLFFYHFWLVALGITLLNALIMRGWAQKFINAQPELAEGYRQLFWGMLCFLGLPWLVMGFGIVVGGVPTPFHFLNPKTGNPFVLAFHLTIVFLWVLYLVWIYFWEGAEFYVKYITPLRRSTALTRSPLGIKVMAAFSLVAGLIGLVTVWFFDYPRPGF